MINDTLTREPSVSGTDKRARRSTQRMRKGRGGEGCLGVDGRERFVRPAATFGSLSSSWRANRRTLMVRRIRPGTSAARNDHDKTGPPLPLFGSRREDGTRGPVPVSRRRQRETNERRARTREAAGWTRSTRTTLRKRTRYARSYLRVFESPLYLHFIRSHH